MFLLDVMQSNLLLLTKLGALKNAVETTAGLLEFLGFTCQIGSVNREYFTSVESPAVFFYKSNPAIFMDSKISVYK